MKRLQGLLVLVCLWALAACQSLPFAEEGVLPPAAVAADGSPERAALNARVYDAATDWIEAHYYDPAFNGRDWPTLADRARERIVAEPTEAGFYAGLSALVDGLDDRHTSVTSPTARARLEAARTGRSAAGFGFGVSRRGERFFVTQVRPDGPAAEAGVKIGWRLVSINGGDAFRAINPQAGRTDAFVFEDERGVEQRLAITGRVLEPRPRQQAERRADGVLVLRFNGFDRLSGDWVKAQVEAALADPPRAIVLDLRDNPGGQAAVLGDVVALFFEGRTDFMVLDGRFIDKVLHNAPSRVVWKGPVAVLVGPGSGSASELLAALVQETTRGVVAGQTSAGAVIGSRPVNLPDGGELSLSLSAVRTGQQRRLLEGVGVTPDIVVEPALDDLRNGRDPALEAAAAALVGQAAEA